MPQRLSLIFFRHIVVKVRSSLLVDSVALGLKFVSLAVLFSLLSTLSAKSVESRYFRKGQDSSAVIIFVHGFLGDAISSWTRGNAYWPEMLAEDSSFNGADIYVYEYSMGAVEARRFGEHPRDVGTARSAGSH